MRDAPWPRAGRGERIKARLSTRVVGLPSAAWRVEATSLLLSFALSGAFASSAEAPKVTARLPSPAPRLPASSGAVGRLPIATRGAEGVGGRLACCSFKLAVKTTKNQT